ncbi:Conserved_hypothetical protein [Hexamita inflata]|uniref:Uncharacterized protein n=1 Tax=Hexamita inflata TaxID=28002 RepID=A0AA86Q601_9EUKA|nr:Conserved hypothetical protein [Hexamita inflata]
MKGPPNPLSKLKLNDDPILVDNEFQMLLSECGEHLSAQFSEFQKKAIPVIQENYMHRNLIFSKCFSEMETYKKLQQEAQSDIKVYFEKYKVLVKNETLKYGQELNTSDINLLKVKNNDRNILTETKQDLDQKLKHYKTQLKQIEKKLERDQVMISKHGNMDDIAGADFFDNYEKSLKTLNGMKDKLEVMNRFKDECIQKQNEIQQVIDK